MQDKSPDAARSSLVKQLVFPFIYLVAGFFLRDGYDYLKNTVFSLDEPNISSETEAVFFRQNINTGQWSGTVYLSVSNMEAQQTLLSLNDVTISFSPTKPSFSVRTAKTIPLPAFAQLHDTTSFNLPGNFPLSQIDSSFAVTIPLYYPSGREANVVHFAMPSETAVNYFWHWPPPSPNTYNELSEISKSDSLPSGWAQYDLSINSKQYQCYYRPSDILVKVSPLVSHYLVRLEHVDPQPNEDLPYYALAAFVPPPSIGYLITTELIVPLYVRTVPKNHTYTESFRLIFSQGYRHFYYLRVHDQHHRAPL